MRLRDQMPEWKRESMWLNSRPLMKHDLRGDIPSLIHFWSVSCSLCKKAMPNINTIYEEYKNHLNVIAVHMPRSDNDFDLEKIKATAKAHHITHPLCIDNDYKLTDAFNNKYVPAYYLFDREGTLRYTQIGSRRLTMLCKRIERLAIKNHA
ncbi:MAG TPA: redoxin domain-containing protein [Bacillota bacterium]|nr:redoxin domain-containing protein [Bacillota bacterium]